MILRGDLWLPDDDRYFGPIFETEGGFQLDRLSRALSHVKEFGTAVDVGAHVGSWAREMCTKFNKVYAFEPVRDTYDCLLKNTELNENILIFNAALSDRAGFAEIQWDAQHKAQGNTGSKFIKEIEKGTTPMYTLDDLNLNSLDFLKLDVEGAEYKVLKGGERTITVNKPVIILEAKRGYGKRFGVEDDAALKLVESFGATLVDRINADHIYMFK